MEPSQICPTCGSASPLSASRCANCGESLSSSASGSARRAEDDAMQHVDVENRIAVAYYELDAQAELACGLLRSGGIACEISPRMIPGLPADTALWVNKQDAENARRILADVEQTPPLDDEDV